MKPPRFSLPNQKGEIRNLADYKGRWVIVYFYPKDDTPGCTTEACSFRDNIALFEGMGVTIFGISKDTVTSHRKFVDKYDLPFDILSDRSAETIQAYGAWGKKKFMGREFDGILRKTFIVGPDGELKKVYPDVTPAEHAQEILKDLKEMQA